MTAREPDADGQTPDPHAALIAEAKTRYDAATAELDRMTSAPGGPGASWRWSIPARPDHDSDLILDASISDVPRLTAALVQEKARADAAEAETERVKVLWDDDSKKTFIRATKAEARADAAEEDLAGYGTFGALAYERQERKAQWDLRIRALKERNAEQARADRLAAIVRQAYSYVPSGASAARTLAQAEAEGLLS